MVNHVPTRSTSLAKSEFGENELVAPILDRGRQMLPISASQEVPFFLQKAKEYGNLLQRGNVAQALNGRFGFIKSHAGYGVAIIRPTGSTCSSCYSN